ncbi:phage portal protein [Campylobacter sputorum]|uniref:phage portal protein n=1 Tax=Campylobacter sputorum TaxID=206 RepID=UPI00068ED23D|nr:phage portal protein [Campylobacter sputorum]
MSRKQKKRVQQFFRFPSLEPNALNANEIYALASNTDIDKSVSFLRKQSRTISVSTSLTTGFFETLSSEVLGEQGIILNINTQDKKLNDRMEKAFFEWEVSCSINGSDDFEDIEEQILRAYYRDGEAFVRIIRGEKLQIEVLDADKIDDNYNDDKQNIKNGIQREESTLKPLFYFYNIEEKGFKKTLKKIPARDILHIKKELVRGQARGITRFAGSIIDINSKDKYKKAELDRARLNSEITGFIIDKDAGTDLGSSDEVEIPQSATTGKMSYIGADMEVKFTPENKTPNIADYLKSTDREVAKSLGMSYENYTGDLSGVNFSSIRQGVLSERRNFRRLQRFLIRKFHNKIFNEWLKIELINGSIKPNEYEKILSNFNFKAQLWEYIDPTKEVNASKIAIQSGFKTRTEVLREKGIELDTFLEDLEKDKQIMQKLKEISEISNNVTKNS